MNAIKKREVSNRLVVNLSACKYPLVREAAERMGYTVSEDDNEMWDLFWSDLSVSGERVQRMLPFQRLNHFPGMLEICRKGALSKHMARMAARLPSEYRFYPPSLVLPDQLDELLMALRRNKARSEQHYGSQQQQQQQQEQQGVGHAGGAQAGGPQGITTFILKPSAGTQGRGISLVQYPNQLKEAGDISSCVAQAYLGTPLLLDGFKFDLRVYALVVSVDPLRIHLYDEGLARLAAQPYQPPTPANLAAVTMHLTNYAVNKGAAGFVSSDAAPAGGGHKRPMSAVLAQLAAQHGTSVAALRASIADVVNKTVMAIQPLLAHSYHTSLSAASGTGSTNSSSSSGSSSSTSWGPRCSCLSPDHVSADAADPTAPCACPPSLCFELLGFDIMFDQQLQPWLLEVNHSPSFASDSRLDRAVKGEMLARTLHSLQQRPEAKRDFLQAEARAQSERLYNSPAAAPSTHAPVGAGLRRALSAMPRNRHLRAAAATLDELAASSAALLAAGGHVWGGGGSATASSGVGGGRPAYGGSNSCGGGGAGGGGGGGGDPNDGPSRRAHSFSSALSAFGAASEDCHTGALGGGGGGGALDVSGGYQLVFPAADLELRKRYCRILLQAADLFPQQRCQCAWCSRRRDMCLLNSAQHQLGTTARPLSAVLSSHVSPRTGYSPFVSPSAPISGSSGGLSGGGGAGPVPAATSGPAPCGPPGAPTAAAGGASRGRCSSATRRRPRCSYSNTNFRDAAGTASAGEESGSESSHHRSGAGTPGTVPWAGPEAARPPTVLSSSPPSGGVGSSGGMAARALAPPPLPSVGFDHHPHGRPPRPNSCVHSSRQRSEGSGTAGQALSGPVASLPVSLLQSPTPPAGSGALPPATYLTAPGTSASNASGAAAAASSGSAAAALRGAGGGGSSSGVGASESATCWSQDAAGSGNTSNSSTSHHGAAYPWQRHSGSNFGTGSMTHARTPSSESSAGSGLGDSASCHPADHIVGGSASGAAEREPNAHRSSGPTTGGSGRFEKLLEAQRANSAVDRPVAGAGDQHHQHQHSQHPRTHQLLSAMRPALQQSQSHPQRGNERQHRQHRQQQQQMQAARGLGASSGSSSFNAASRLYASGAGAGVGGAQRPTNAPRYGNSRIGGGSRLSAGQRGREGASRRDNGRATGAEAAAWDSDAGSDGGPAAPAGDALRRSHSCSELEAAFARASANRAAGGSGARASAHSSGRPSAATPQNNLLATVNAQRSGRAQPEPYEQSQQHTQQAEAGAAPSRLLRAASAGRARPSGSGAGGGAGAGGGEGRPAAPAGGVPRVAYLGNSKATPVLGPGELEIMLSRVRMATTFSNRYVR
ncbi:hypothetical protein HYH02_013575 [Chlamydomonas schloesseri]|uniref:Uncharacterized protein n=1 Tax=Chlamydomonas schloesseri TaxID=2026947 RepID=A0A835VZI5_9CHLO|nr:hypothetical protein HYH02_013575 [Chlamydomonas schloesseri]|eukprot:KAG2430736.1 hypothetical protein HYH02_013575 [Chlamydomonas schloesseri]